MTRFTKDTLVLTRASTETWIHYHAPGQPGKFVSRLKYGAKSSAGALKTFLIRNFTVEELFEGMEKTDPKTGQKMGTLAQAEAKGFVLVHLRKWLADGGYEVSQAGFKQYIMDGVRKDAIKYAMGDDPKLREIWIKWLQENYPNDDITKLLVISERLPSFEEVQGDRLYALAALPGAGALS